MMAVLFLKQVRIQHTWGRGFSSKGSSFGSAITEFNKEMDSIFGEPPSASGIDSPAVSEPSPLSSGPREDQQALSHVDTSGQAAMVDVSSKEDSKRIAVASCRVLLGQKAFSLVAANQISKGDVLNVAKIAGISGAKQTSCLIPLCHNIGLTHIHVDLTLNEKDSSVEIEGEAATTGKTGVEMEAMTAVAVAGQCMTCVKLYQRIFRLLIFVLSTRREERVGSGPEIGDQQQRESANASEAIKVNVSMLSDGVLGSIVRF